MASKKKHMMFWRTFMPKKNGARVANLIKQLGYAHKWNLTPQNVSTAYPTQFMIRLDLLETSRQLYLCGDVQMHLFLGPASNSILLTSYFQDGQHNKNEFSILPGILKLWYEIFALFRNVFRFRNWVTRWYNSGVSCMTHGWNRTSWIHQSATWTS